MKKLTFIVGMFCWATNSHSALVTWEVNAAITELQPDMIGYANIGDIITLRYTFDSLTPDVEPYVVERGKYDGAVTNANIFLNSDVAQLESVGYITVLNDYSGSEDVYLTSSTDTAIINDALSSYNGFGFVGYTFTYKDVNATMFNDTNLMIDPIITGYDGLRLTLHFRNPPDGTVGLGSAIFADDLISISRISAVQIPASAWLFISGLLSLLGVSKRKQHIIRPSH